MRVGLFGGSFDPVHTGHLVLAEQCREQASLDIVWWIPSHTAPHKQQGPRASDRQRLEMVQLAIAGHEHFRASDMEIERAGVSYTVDTLRQWKATHPEDDLFLIIGGDSLEEFSTWKSPSEICELATPLVYARPGHQAPLDLLAPYMTLDRLARIRAAAIEARQIDISSTDLRLRIASGKSIRYLTPRAVERYIETAGLYSLVPSPPRGG